MNTKHTKLVLILTFAVTLMVTGVFTADKVNAAQNASYPNPAQCEGADWNIGLPDGITCSLSVSTVGALENDSKATQAMGGLQGRLEPESPGGLATMNKFCQAYTGDSSSYATYGRMHKYCGGGNNNNWWTGSNWSTQSYSAGKLNVQNVTCATQCKSSVTYPLPSPIVCASGYTNVVTNKTITEYAPNAGSSGRQSVNLAIDGNVSTWWATGSFSPASATIDLQQDYTLNKYSIKCGGISNGNSGTVHFLDSNGSEVATKYYTCQGSNHPINQLITSVEATFDSPITVRKIKVDATSVAGGDWINIHELEACGKTPAPTCTSHASKKCVGNSVYWYDSCGTKQEIYQECTANQTCSDGTCVDQNIACSTNSQCGTNGYVGSPFCLGNSVYKSFRTYKCNNAGTSSSYCSNSTADKKVTDCTANQTCSNGTCVDQNIACTTNSQCGTNGYTGSPFCSGGDVYKSFKTYTCNNAGTSSSYCSNSTADKKVTDCTANQTCSNGSCHDQDIACSSASQCGTNGYTGDAFCNNGDVYKTYRTYTCNNAGTSSSYCSSATADQLVTDCASGQTCSNGSCQNQNIACSSNSDCGSSGYLGSPFCSGGDVYKTYRTYTCNNAGTSSSYCSTSTSDQLVTDCASGQTCSNGSCSSSCTDHYYKQCSGNYLYWYDSCGYQDELYQYCPYGCSGSTCNQGNNLSVQTNSATNINNNQATLNGYLYENDGSSYYNTTVWFQWGSTTSYGSETNHQTIGYSGNFSQIINLYSYNSNTTYHYRAVGQSSNGNAVYGQDMTFTTGSTTGTLNVTKTVRNLTTGNSTFSNSTYANPSDMLMFMITIQANGNQDLQNVVVKDYLANNLIYKNQLVVSGSNNYSNYNYNGDITSGINLGTITAGQTITITYQTQVAAAQNFAYGTTTLTNSVYVSSSNTNYNPTSNASVLVTRTAVYGASSISTGLTNNFWTDSFILPLLIALMGIALLRSGMFFGVERWVDNKKKMYRSYKADKELNAMVAKIRKTKS